MRTNEDLISSSQSTQCPHCERLKSCSKGFCLTVVTQHQIWGIWSQSALTTLLNFLQGRLTWTQVRIFNFDLCHSVNFPFFFLSHGFKISSIILLKVWFLILSHNYPEGKSNVFLYVHWQTIVLLCTGVERLLHLFGGLVIWFFSLKCSWARHWTSYFPAIRLWTCVIVSKRLQGRE